MANGLPFSQAADAPALRAQGVDQSRISADPRRGTEVSLTSMLSIADLELAAQRRLPSSVFGYVMGGAENEVSLRSNRKDFDQWRFLPQALVDVSVRSQATELFGKRYDSPFGIAPMGVASICHFDGDRALARAALRANVPFVLSGASTTPLEKIAAVCPDAWFQAYLPSDRGVIQRMLDRVAAAKISTLVMTIDVPIASMREMELRNGFSIPLRPSTKLIMGGLAKPRWMLETLVRTLLRQGIPRFENFSADKGHRIITAAKGDHRAGRAAMCWDDIRWIRENWKGRLLLKGILRPEDACTAQRIGVDGVIVSNHGGRQLDGAISTIDALPPIVAAAPQLPVMIDSGFRRGTDILKALSLGAKFVFVGRPAMLGLAVGGEAGVVRALTLLRREIDVNLGLLGCPDISELSRDFLQRRTDSGFDQ